MMYRRRGRSYALIELLVVLSIVCFVSAMLIVRSSPTTRRFRSRNIQDQIVRRDAVARGIACRRACVAELVYDFGDNALSIEANEGEVHLPKLRLGSSVKLRSLHLPDESCEFGAVAVRILPSGASPTYAVQLQTTGQANAWIVFLGGTGKPIIFSDDNEHAKTKIDEILRASSIHSD